MSINSVSSIGSFTGCQGSNLSEETKRKLRELGVEPSTVANEFQAQQLIKTLEQKLEQVHKSASFGNARKATTGEAELIAKAKALANQVGISVSSTDSLSDIFSKIKAKINTMEAQGQDIKAYKSELSALEDKYSTVQQNQSSMLSAMNYTASLNKYMLGFKIKKEK